jgi:hypothetical protein
MNHISSKGKEIKIPGTEHPITNFANRGQSSYNGRRANRCRIDASTSVGGEGIPARLLLATQRCGHLVARSDHPSHLLSI